MHLEWSSLPETSLVSSPNKWTIAQPRCNLFKLESKASHFRLVFKTSVGVMTIYARVTLFMSADATSGSHPTAIDCEDLYSPDGDVASGKSKRIFLLLRKYRGQNHLCFQAKTWNKRCLKNCENISFWCWSRLSTLGKYLQVGINLLVFFLCVLLAESVLLSTALSHPGKAFMNI